MIHSRKLTHKLPTANLTIAVVHVQATNHITTAKENTTTKPSRIQCVLTFDNGTLSCRYMVGHGCHFPLFFSFITVLPIRCFKQEMATQLNTPHEWQLSFVRHGGSRPGDEEQHHHKRECTLALCRSGHGEFAFEAYSFN